MVQASTEKDEEEFRATLLAIQKGALLWATVHKLIKAWDTQESHDPMAADQGPYRQAFIDFDDAIRSLRQQTTPGWKGKVECPSCTRREKTLLAIKEIVEDKSGPYDCGWDTFDQIHDALNEGLKEDDDVQEG